jgi:MFS family permease
MEANTKTDLRNSIYDGILANIFATLTGGVFLTGFALYLGMNEFMIGLLASMPFLVTVFQLPTSYHITKRGKRKEIAYLSAAVARLIWIPILVTGLLPIFSAPIKILVILSMFFLSYSLLSVSYVSWLSWMSDLVPDEERGRFFGTRNMLCGAAGVIVLVVFGKLNDTLDGQSNDGSPTGFVITFLSAVLFGILSLRFLNRVSEPQARHIQNGNSFRENLSHPFKQGNFRKFLIFAYLWGFSVNFASPFFTLYFLRDLRFSYGFVATLALLSTFADLIGMQFWGRISDRVKNKAVIRLAGWVAIFLPLAWVTVRPESLFMPIFLHLIGGGFWAGINLCMNNLLLRISPQEGKAWFLSIYNIVGGLGAATGPVLSGFVIISLGHLDLRVFSWNLVPIQAVFIASSLFRLLSFQIFKYINEPEEVSVGQMVRILRSVRGLNMAAGFNSLLHPFIETSKDKTKPLGL